MLTPQAALRKIYYLKLLPDEALNTLIAASSIRRLQRGELLILEGAKCAELIVVLAGAVRIYKLDSRGRELTLDRELPGKSVLEMCLFDGGNYPANVEGAEEDTAVLIVARDTVYNLMSAYPHVAIAALKALGVRMRKLIVTLEAQSLYPVRARLAAYILEAAQGRTTFMLQEKNEEIGNRIGTVREVVSRTMHGLKDAGAITLNGRHITVVDAEALRRIASMEIDLDNL